MSVLKLNSIGIRGTMRYVVLNAKLYFCERDVLRNFPDTTNTLETNQVIAHKFFKNQVSRGVSYDAVLDHVKKHTQDNANEFARLCEDLLVCRSEPKANTLIYEQKQKYSKNVQCSKGNRLQIDRQSELEFLRQKLDLLRQLKEIEVCG